MAPTHCPFVIVKYKVDEMIVIGAVLHPRTRTNHKRRRLQSANNKPVLSWENYIIQTLAPFGAISFCKQHSG